MCCEQGRAAKSVSFTVEIILKKRLKNEAFKEFIRQIYERFSKKDGENKQGEEMIQIEIFCHNEIVTLEKVTNAFLQKDNIQVVDIKSNTCYDPIQEWIEYSAMIIYKKFD